MKPNYPQWPQFDQTSADEIALALKSGKVNYWTGTKGREFETHFAKWCSTNFAISTTNGTSALHTIIGSMDIGPGDEVIVPSYSFIATSYAVLQAGAIPRFCDVTSDHTINPDRIEALVTERTKAIVVVHLYGVVCDMDPINEIADRYQLKVIEDAAQCIGGKYKGNKVGTLGDAAAFSFCQSKHFTTGGEGGMIVTDDEGLAWRCRSFRDHGFDVKQKLALLDMEEKQPYIHERIGYNYRMTEIQSIVGINELNRFDDWNLANRKRNAFIYDEILKDSSLIESLPFNSSERENAYWLYPITLVTSITEQQTHQLYKSLVGLGIPVTKVLWPETFKENVYRNLQGFGQHEFPFNSSEYRNIESVNYTETRCPMANSLSKRTINLHLYPTLEPEHIEGISHAFKELLNQLEVSSL
ncbi:DegT/DnrJ/EryC1/StrS family aminotransferase [Vibrio sagamiensis]|uniref:Aminotransferase n=1 Tax=Vibrio sagamiensis NBRC 104589 TaxID=1219064 RepID=A0A511QA75_9VIBR|nr:DegT/DnrJ/EryC1/StrS family aminotransferase [Vibrio sagamiensis]PNQ62138.1 DegT/DnrJ/EryC1/StrS family aminotransferase [Vibrio agarivorans]GEM74118.1 aminotransferase [Vibrio sagamiensis NBRC 104589]